MTTATLVRDEAEAVSNQLEGERGYYLARGGVEAAVHAIVRSRTETLAGRQPSGFVPGERWLRFEFPEGVAVVEVVPENAKVSVNQAPVAQLAALFLQLGQNPEASREVAEAIADWRAPRQSSVSSRFDLFYAALDPPYAAAHRAFSHLEELLAVKGMSKELFFGRLVEMPDGRWRRLLPLPDLLTTEMSFAGVNVNYAAEEVLRVLPGWSADLAAAVVLARSARPFRTMEELRSAVPDVGRLVGVSPMTLAPSPVYTLTATGAVGQRSVLRTVRTQIRVEGAQPFAQGVLGWWSDWPWSGVPADRLSGALEEARMGVQGVR